MNSEKKDNFTTILPDFQLTWRTMEPNLQINGRINGNPGVDFVDSIDSMHFFSVPASPEIIVTENSIIKNYSSKLTACLKDRYVTLKDPADNRVNLKVVEGGRKVEALDIYPHIVTSKEPLEVHVPDSWKFCRNPFLNSSIAFIKRRGMTLPRQSNQEETARELLRDLISETEYRRYLKYGFITYTAVSGLTYQIFYNPKSHVIVRDKNLIIEELCLRISDHSIPPTDGVVSKLIMLSTDEEELRKMSNVYNMMKKAA